VLGDDSSNRCDRQCRRQRSTAVARRGREHPGTDPRSGCRTVAGRRGRGRRRPAAALLDDKHAGAAYQLTGPASITQAEQVRAIAAATGREVRFEELTPERARAAMAQVMPAEIADLMLGYLAGSVDTVAEVLPTVEQVTGRPARTYAEWAADHAADFTPAQ
jgi:hypothetical protein